MQEFDDQDTCRICSAPAENDQPLFHPCKCSGTIRYIHQDCLTTWLAHSKKKSCDVCKHPYSFTKVYAPDMPPSLPPLLLIRRLLQHLFLTLLLVLRAFAVATIWLGVLPWVTVWTWRMYFSMGESTAWWISDRPRPSSTDTSPFYNKIHYEPPVPPKNLFARITSHPVWLTVSADIFTGQIIASLIVLTFVAVFLLREWISQNARPGVFEDEEVPPDDQPQMPPEVIQAQQPDPVPLLEPLPAQLVFLDPQQRHPLPPFPPVNPPPLLPDQNVPHQRMDALPAMESPQLQRQNFIPIEASVPDRWGDENPDDVNRRTKKKHRLKQSDGEEDDAYRRKVDKEEIKRKMFHRRIHIAKSTAERRRVFVRRAASSPPSPPFAHNASPSGVGEKSKFDFTFKAPSLASTTSPSSPADFLSLQPPIVSASASLPALASSAASSSPPADEKASFESPFPSVELQPPSGYIPFSLRALQSSNSPPTFPPPYPSRPPLPTITLPQSGSASPFVYTGRTPLESPTLSTYRPPEELEADLTAPSYFALNYLEDEVDSREDQGHLPSSSKGKMNEVIELASNSSNSDREHDGDQDSLSGLGKDEIETGYNHYFVDPKNGAGDVSTRTSLELLSDSDSEASEDDDGRGAGDLIDMDDDDVQMGLLGFNNGMVNRDAVDENVEGRGEGIVIEPAQGEVRVQGPAAANQPAAEEPAANADLNEEPDANAEDDMEGAMEAIGMRGPIFGVFQNAALMIFVLDTAIGLFIWVPFTIGKTTALLSLDPHRMLQVLHFPIRAMRFITDPIVDLVVFVIVDLIFPRVLHLLTIGVHILMFFCSKSIGRYVTTDMIPYPSDISRLQNQTLGFITKPMDYITLWSATSNITTSSNSDLPFSVLDFIPDYLGPFETYFAAVGSEIRELASALRDTWIRLALGTGPTSRVFAIFLGDMVSTFLFCIYLNVLTVGNAKTAGAALRNAIRQQMLVIKVAAFIFIELVIFPLGCGIVLDMCTVWLFPEANMYSRVAFFGQAPLTAMFYHWVAGTMFMYTFAVLLSGCRSVMRPGAMWFIKDPQDQNSHPIRDILDRPTLVQLRKIFISGLMYSFVVACVVGSVAGLFVMGSKSIMPFRWKNREPLSDVPIDLLFLHLVLPYTMHYFRPKRVIKEAATVVWKFLAARLRLTSYFFGGRYPQEEFTPKQWRDNFVRSDTFVVDPDVPLNGSFRRVPATDNLALPRDMRATAAVSADGEPVDEAARVLIAVQDIEAEKAKRNAKDDYTIVYIPPHFRWRIFTFIALLWIFGAICVGFAVAIPLSLGRSFFRLFTSRDVHDGYSFIIGFYLIWVCYLVARAIDRLDRRRKRRSGTDGPRAELGLLIAKRGLLWLAKIIFMVFFLGIVVPILLAIVIDFYIVLPIRFSVDPGTRPRIRIVDHWALGLLYAKIGMYLHRIQPPDRISRGLQQIITLGWTRPDPIMATKEVIAPLVGGFLGMIVLPAMIFRVVQYYFPIIGHNDRFIFMHVYPSVFALAGTVRSMFLLFKLLSTWSSAIRDKEFLVEMRLRNHEPEQILVDERNHEGDADLRDAVQLPGVEPLQDLA